jgi:hypothetical protein
MKNSLALLTWCTLLLSCWASAAERINWKHWELDAFETTEAQNKIILVNVGMEGGKLSVTRSIANAYSAIADHNVHCLLHRAGKCLVWHAETGNREEPYRP